MSAAHITFDIAGTNVTIHRIPEDNLPHLASKLIRRGNHVSYLAGGQMYSSRVGPGRWYAGRNWGGRLDLIRDAIALGLVADRKKAADLLLRKEEKRRLRNDRGRGAREVLVNAALAGIKLTPRQIKEARRLDRASRR